MMYKTILLIATLLIPFSGAIAGKNGKDGKDYFIVGEVTDENNNQYYIVRGEDGEDYLILKSDINPNS